MTITDELIYLDHNATTPVDPRVMEAMLPYFTEKFGNAASDHRYGLEAKRAVDRARERIASVINARPSEIIFTSGATESDNIVLFGVAEKYADQGNHIITCATEHKAVLDCCKQLERMGKRVTYLPVDMYGLVDPAAVRQAITPDTILISIMAANNEIGTIAPTAEIGRIARGHGVLFHTDAAQAVGHIPIDVQAMEIDAMSMSAHKVYGPKGVGAFYRRRSNPRVLLEPRIYGGGHERGLRSGTLNVPAIVGFGKAVDVAHQSMDADAAQYRTWTRRVYERLHAGVRGVQLNGHPTERLPNNLSLTISGIEAKSLVMNLRKVALSTGSACSASTAEASHVLLALGLGADQAHSVIRVGVGRSNTEGQIDYAIDQLGAVIQTLRRISQR